MCPKVKKKIYSEKQENRSVLKINYSFFASFYSWASQKIRKRENFDLTNSPF
jgi:hypothetical protein